MKEELKKFFSEQHDLFTQMHRKNSIFLESILKISEKNYLYENIFFIKSYESLFLQLNNLGISIMYDMSMKLNESITNQEEDNDSDFSDIFDALENTCDEMKRLIHSVDTLQYGFTSRLTYKSIEKQAHEKLGFNNTNSLETVLFSISYMYYDFLCNFTEELDDFIINNILEINKDTEDA